MTPTTIIFLALGIFFLLVAIWNRIRSVREHRRLADIRSAALNGGTPESPVHLESPFSPRAPEPPPAAPVAPQVAPVPPSVAPMPQTAPVQPTPAALVAQPAVPPAAPAAAPAAAASKDEYEWE